MIDPSTNIYSIEELQSAPDHIFEGAISRISNTLNGEFPPSQTELFALMVSILDKDSLQQFFLWLLQGINTKHIHQIQEIEPYNFPEKKGNFLAVDNFFNCAEPNTGNTHAITRDEYAEALPKMQNMQPLQHTLEFIERGLYDYINALTHKVQHIPFDSMRIEDVNDANLFIKRILPTKSLLEEFMPMLTFQAALETEKDLSSSGCAKTMHAMFGERSSFKNTYINRDGKKRTHTCPFEDAFPHLINSVFLQDGNGVFYMDDTPVHGGMIMSLLPLFDDSNSLAFENNQIIEKTL